MDRISYLPDDLLLKIMSELPTKDVVSTMLLSERWKLLWTMVTKLYFDDSCLENKESVPYRIFQGYIDRFLVTHKPPVLEALKFKLGRLSTTDDITTWIRFAIPRSVSELDINRSFHGYDYSFKLPECLYTYETLVVLKLSNMIYLDVPMEVCLSSLKVLHLLNLLCKNANPISRLLSGCPVLEELVIDKNENEPEPFLYVIVPSLQRLSISSKHRNQAFVEVQPEFFEEEVLMNVPSLKYLNYVDTYDYGHVCSSNSMPELVEATVKLVCKRPEKLMRSITSVKRLSLCLYGSMLQHRIKFNQLVHLELCGCPPKWWDLLTWMLHSCPKLQVLKLNKFEERWSCYIVEPIEGHWEKPSSVPKCLLLHLNTFEWSYYNGGRQEKKVVAYILENARCLNTAAFDDIDISSDEKANRKIKELLSLPRASSSCQISFSVS